MVTGETNRNMLPEFFTGRTQSHPNLHTPSLDQKILLNTTLPLLETPQADPPQDHIQRLADFIVGMQGKPIF